MKLEIFKNNEFGAVRVLADERGEPWMVAKDVCDVLGYANSRDAINDNVDEEDRINLKEILKSSQQLHLVKQDLKLRYDTILINESGLYSLILRSNKPEAKKFKKWVTGEVLPAIRKHGLYATDEVIEKTLNNPDFMIEILQKLKEEKQARLKAENKINLLTHTKKTYTTTEIAKELGFRSANELNKKLNELGIQYKVNGIWVLNAKYADKEYMEQKQGFKADGLPIYYPRWTQKGREFLLELLSNQDFSKSNPALQVNSSKGIQNEKVI